MLEFLNGLSEGTKVLLVLSIILFGGFVMTRLTNTLNLPKVSGYILAGILIGPCGLNFIPPDIIGHMGFVSDLALAFIAFGVGKFFKKEVIKQTGKKIIIITTCEALTAGVLVTLAVKYLFGLTWDFSLILGAIATATAPASTMMTINQYKAKGEFVNTLLQIVALDDVVCLLAFSVVSAIASGHASGGVAAQDIMLPIVYNILALFLGFFCGYFLSRLLIPTRSRDNRLILAIAMLLGISGICAAVDISPLLSCMVFGAAYINLTRDKKLYRQINNFTPPIMSIFFIVSGMNLDVRSLTTVGAVGVCYFIVRIIGKYLGTYVSCLITGTSSAIRNYMGLALIPQAGVAIGLAFLGQRMLPPETGKLMLTIILSSSVLYEMVGPVSAKAALFLSGAITPAQLKTEGEKIIREITEGIPAEPLKQQADPDQEKMRRETADAFGRQEPLTEFLAEGVREKADGRDDISLETCPEESIWNTVEEGEPAGVFSGGDYLENSVAQGLDGDGEETAASGDMSGMDGDSLHDDFAIQDEDVFDIEKDVILEQPEGEEKEEKTKKSEKPAREKERKPKNKKGKKKKA